MNRNIIRHKAINKPLDPTNIESTIVSRHDDIDAKLPELPEPPFSAEQFEQILEWQSQYLDLLLAPFQEDRYDIDDTNFNIILLRRLAKLNDLLFMKLVPSARENIIATFDDKGQVKDSGVWGKIRPAETLVYNSGYWSYSPKAGMYGEYSTLDDLMIFGQAGSINIEAFETTPPSSIEDWGKPQIPKYNARFAMSGGAEMFMHGESRFHATTGEIMLKGGMLHLAPLHVVIAGGYGDWDNISWDDTSLTLNGRAKLVFADEVNWQASGSGKFSFHGSPTLNITGSPYINLHDIIDFVMTGAAKMHLHDTIDFTMTRNAKMAINADADIVIGNEVDYLNGTTDEHGGQGKTRLHLRGATSVKIGGGWDGDGNGGAGRVVVNISGFSRLHLEEWSRTYMQNHAFLQMTGNSHSEMHDYSRFVMRGRSMDSDYPFSLPLPSGNSPYQAMVGDARIIMRSDLMAGGSGHSYTETKMEMYGRSSSYMSHYARKSMIDWSEFHMGNYARQTLMGSSQLHMTDSAHFAMNNSTQFAMTDGAKLNLNNSAILSMSGQSKFSMHDISNLHLTGASILALHNEARVFFHENTLVSLGGNTRLLHGDNTQSVMHCNAKFIMDGEYSPINNFEHRLPSRHWQHYTKGSPFLSVLDSSIVDIQNSSRFIMRRSDEIFHDYNATDLSQGTPNNIPKKVDGDPYFLMVGDSDLQAHGDEGLFYNGEKVCTEPCECSEGAGDGNIISFPLAYSSQFNPITAQEFDDLGLTASNFRNFDITADGFNWGDPVDLGGQGWVPEQFESVPEGYHITIHDKKQEVAPGVFRVVDTFYKEIKNPLPEYCFNPITAQQFDDIRLTAEQFDNIEVRAEDFNHPDFESITA